jgi:HD domain
MQPRRSEYDVTNRVNTTDPLAVHQEVSRIYLGLYPDAPVETLGRAFNDCARLFRGEYPGYRACDTAYHNLQHTLDVALAMARLMDGYDRSAGCAEPIGARLFRFGIIAALLHDVGYLRHRHDTRHQNGAEYTLCHVSRGSRFVEHYMSRLGMSDLASVAASIIHFTGYEMPVDAIEVPGPMFRRLGNMLGTADIIAQMADRCYLEKCRDRLFPEFVAGGLVSEERPEVEGAVRFSSAQDLLYKTPAFYSVAKHRLNELLGGAYGYAETHFGGANLYLEEVMKNIRHAERVAENGDITALLRRNPPPRQQSSAFVAREPDRVLHAA